MTKIELAQTEDSVLSFEISDEALESAGENVTAANYTLGACTGLSVCPG
jgi:tRNA/tmRNA/rRNA uracil-C5-methylase (TrmA/RlmC/RlmD family)